MNRHRERIELIKVTPKIARDWLDGMRRMLRNRDLKQSNVRNMKHIINEDVWDRRVALLHFINVDGEQICINGQHRLTAIVELNVVLECYCMFDCTRDLMDVLDQTMAPRSPGDVFLLRGTLDKYYHQGAALAKRILSYNPKRPKTLWRNDATKPTHKALEEVIFKDKELIERILRLFIGHPFREMTSRQPDRLALISRPHATFLYWLFTKCTNEAAAMQFFFELENRTTSYKASPIKKLHAKLLRAARERKHIDLERVPWVILAFNAWVQRTSADLNYESGKDDIPLVIKRRDFSADDSILASIKKEHAANSMPT